VGKVLPGPPTRNERISHYILNVKKDELYPQDIEPRNKRKRSEYANTLPHPIVIPPHEEDDANVSRGGLAKISSSTKAKTSSTESLSSCAPSMQAATDSQSRPTPPSATCSSRGPPDFEAAWACLNKESLELYAEDPAAFTQLLFKMGALSSVDLEELEMEDHLIIADGLKKPSSKRFLRALRYID
jgi:hypothetical protein